MSEPTNILGKIGKATGDKIKALQTQIDNIDVNNVSGDVQVTGDIDGVNLTATGDLEVGGHLICDSLLVKGETKVINTETVEVSDNQLELNKSADGSPTAVESGIIVNRGSNDIINPVDSFIPTESATENNITNAVFKNTITGTMLDSSEGVSSIVVTITDDTERDVVFAEDDGEHNLVTDLGTNQKFAPIYKVIEGDWALRIHPIFSLTKDGDTFRANNSEDEKFIDLTEAYLRGYHLWVTYTGVILSVDIRSISYSIEQELKANLNWNNIAEKWSFKLGGEPAQVQGIFQASDGDGIQINDVSFGTYADFKQELELALNTSLLVCTPIAVQGYYPLYTSIDCATISGSGTYHEHTLNDIVYYMPDGVDFWHGDYGGYNSEPYFADNANYTQTKADLDALALDPITDVLAGSIVKILQGFTVYGDTTTVVEVGEYFIVDEVKTLPTRVVFDVNGVANEVGQRGTVWELVQTEEISQGDSGGTDTQNTDSTDTANTQNTADTQNTANTQNTADTQNTANTNTDSQTENTANTNNTY